MGLNFFINCFALVLKVSFDSYFLSDAQNMLKVRVNGEIMYAKRNLSGFDFLYFLALLGSLIANPLCLVDII